VRTRGGTPPSTTWWLSTWSRWGIGNT